MRPPSAMPWPLSAVNSRPRRLSQAHGITETCRNSQPTCSAASCSSPADRPDVQSQDKSLTDSVAVDSTGRILVGPERIRALLNVSQGTLQNRVAEGEYPKAGRGLYDLAACVQAELRLKARGEGRSRAHAEPSRRLGDNDRFGPLWHFASRLDAWQDIRLRQERSPERTVKEVAAEYETEPAAVLTWLRAGLPYAQEGDWHTGEGFLLRNAWTFDWILALACVV